jgi:hypothetical protein
LLVKVNRADSVLDFFEVRCDVDDIIHGAHITEEADKASLAKLHKFFGNPHVIEMRIIEVVPDENIARQSGDVFFDEGVSVDEVVDTVGRKNMLQF